MGDLPSMEEEARYSLVLSMDRSLTLAVWALTRFNSFSFKSKMYILPLCEPIACSESVTTIRPHDDFGADAECADEVTSHDFGYVASCSLILELGFFFFFLF